MRMPGFIKPQLATLKMKAPGKGYLDEIKFDGYRVQIHTGSAPRAFTRNGHDWVKRFSRIAGALDIPPAIIDGEVVVVHEGRTNFSELQAELAGERQDRLLYYAFDLLWLDAKDLRKSPQVERKAILKSLFDTYKLEPPVLYSDHHEGNGQDLFEAASYKLRRHRFQKSRCALPIGQERELAENQNRPEGEVSRRWIC